MRNSMDAIDNGEVKEIKNISGRRSIRDKYNYEEISSRKKVNNNEDRSISEPPNSRYSSTYINNHNASSRLKTIREKQVDDDHNRGSSEDDEDFSKSNSQLNESDLDLEIPESASLTPTPTLLSAKARRINSETNLNDSKRRLTGFMGNRSKRFCASTSELSFASHLDTHKSLFSPKNNQNSRSGSLYGSNMSLNSTNSRLFMVSSPFYNGKTMFGGASAYPRRDINQHKVLRTPIQMRPSSSLSNSSNTSTKSEGGIVPESNAAKRILEIMTQFTGPLKDTRSMGSNISSMIKIPGLVQNRKRFGEEDLQLDRSISLTRPTAPYSRPIVTSSKNNQPESPSILLNSTNSKTPQIPTMSQLLKMKRLQNNTEKVREIANRSESFLNNVQDYKLPSTNDDLQSNNNNIIAVNSSTSSSFKMKSNITKNLLRNDKSIDELPPAPLNLPNIQLPELKSIPKFDIKLPATSTSTVNTAMSITSNLDKVPTLSSLNSISSFKTATDMTTINQSTEIAKEQFVTKANHNFIFSKPIQINVSDADIQNFKVTTDSFKFSKPILIEDIETHKKESAEIQSTKPVTDNLFKNLAAKQKTQWECESCMTRNDMDKAKCLCCDTLKRDSGISSQSSLSPVKDTSDVIKTPQSDDLFKKLAAQQKKSQWECTECMTKNDLDKNKCLCCEAWKPGSKPETSSLSSVSSAGFKFGMPTSTSTSVANDDLFKNLAAQQKKSQWECSECMSSNDMSKDKCVCCEAVKPGSKAPSQSTFGGKSSIIDITTAPKFSFGMPAVTTSPSSKISTDQGFKKLIETQNAKWECSACMTRNDQTQSKCICCEQAKPGSSENSSQFSFGSGKITSSVTLPAPSEVKFSFGVQPSKSETTIVEEKKVEENKKEDVKIDEVDKPKAFAGPTFTFKAPQASSVSASFVLKSPKTDEKKDEKDENKDVTTDKSPMFTFGSKIESVPEKKVAFEIVTKSTDEKVEKLTENKPIGGFSFPISTSTPIENSTNALKTNGGFSFGAFSKPETASKDENKPASTGFQFSSSTSSPFSSSPAPSISTAETNTIKPASTFTFGSPKIAEKSDAQKPTIFGSFGNTAQTSSPFSGLSNTPTPVVTTSATPIFGQQSSAPSFSFGSTAAKKDENAFAFGTAVKSTSSSSNMIFGSSASNTPSLTPMFGASSAPTFGSNLTNTTNNNNESGFGSKMVGFGGIQSTPNQPQKRPFDFGSAEVPQKKFDFGSQTQQQQSQPSSSSPFQFNAQQSAEAVKPAFNFSATASAPQTFSFTGANSNNNMGSNNVQENLFQFGANSTSSQGIYAFGTNAQPQQSTIAPVMQFGVASNTTAPTIAIPGINTFGAQSSAANAPQRKILRAARRATRR